MSKIFLALIFFDLVILAAHLEPERVIIRGEDAIPLLAPLKNALPAGGTTTSATTFGTTCSTLVQTISGTNAVVLTPCNFPAGSSVVSRTVHY